MCANCNALRKSPRGTVSLGFEPIFKALSYCAHTLSWSYVIAEHLTKHGLLFCVDAQRDRKRFIVKADDLLTAFLSLERDAISAKQGLTGSVKIA